MSKQRHYYYIEGKDPLDPSQIKYITRPIECDDTLEEELVMMAFPIKMLSEISTVLANFNLRSDSDYFYSECREVVSVPEKHVNEKGEGKLSFQSYFHKFPDSVINFYDDSMVVVMLHPREQKEGNFRDYNMIGYIHVNHIDFKDPSGELHKGYYYNILRMSEATVDGKSLYRRKRLFSTIFSALLDITTLNNIHFVYANMGRENQGILDALKMNTTRNGKLYETFAMRNNTHINFVTASKSASKKLVDISHNKELLLQYYKKVYANQSTYIFNQMHSEKNFFSMLDRILGSSPTTRVFMLPDAQGNMEAAGFFINWADYLKLKLQNPKGLFKIIDNMNITDNILYSTLLVGDPQKVRELVKGATYHFRKNHSNQISVLNGQIGDPHFEVKKSVVYDPFVYFVIYDRPELFEAMKNHSKDAEGNMRIFIDIPML